MTGSQQLTPELWITVALFSSPRGVCNIEQLNKTNREIFKKATSGNNLLQRSWYLRYQLIVWDKEHLPKSISTLNVGQLPSISKSDARKDWKFTFKQEWQLELSRMMKTPTTQGPGSSGGASGGSQFPKFASPTSAGVAQNFLASANGTRRTFMGEGDNREVVENTNHAVGTSLSDSASNGTNSAPRSPVQPQEGVTYAGDVHFTQNGARGGASPKMPASPVVKGAPDWKNDSRKFYKGQKSKPKDKTMKGGQNYWASYDELTDFGDQ